MIKNRHYRNMVAVGLMLFSSALLATAETDYEQGVASYKAGDHAAAINYFESAKKQGMDSVALQYNLASSYYRAGRHQEAKTYFNKLLETEAMRDIANYHLGLIAVKEKDGSSARRYFNAVATSGKDEKLIKLSEKHLAALTIKEDKWRSNISFSLGHDDNISSVSGDSVLDQSDSFAELYASTEYLLSGKRKHGWLASASLYGIEYSETDSNDLYSFSLGLKRSMKIDDWSTSAHLNLAKSTYAGDDFQRISKLDIIARKPLSKRERLYLRYQVEDIRSDNSLYDYLEGWRQRARAEYRHYGANNIKHLYYELELNDRGQLVTSIDAYDYSPTRHTVRGLYTHIIDEKWWLNADLAYKMSEFDASPTIDRSDDQWKLGLSADYRFDKTLKLTTSYQYTDNVSSVDRYTYDKSVIRIGLSKLF